MKTSLHEAVVALKTVLPPPRNTPIEVTTKSSIAGPLWNRYITTLATKTGDAGKHLLETLYHMPPMAAIPAPRSLVAYVKNSSIDEIFLAYTTCLNYAQTKNTIHVAPSIHPQTIDTLVENHYNPATLWNTLYLTPYIASIPTIALQKIPTIFRELLALKATTYIARPDRSTALLGYLIHKALKTRPLTHHEAFTHLIGIIRTVLAKKNLTLKLTPHYTDYEDFTVILIHAEIHPTHQPITVQ